jgi:hypothetical protein
VRTPIRVTAAAAVAADHRASQGSLTADPRHGLLYAVNAGSDTISVFAVHGDLVYVLKA